MSDPQIDPVVERLRANLRYAGIAASEADIQGILERGFLRITVAFDELARRQPLDLVPDYLGSWEPEASPLTSLPSPASAELAAGQPAGTIAAIAGRLRSRDVSPVELTEQALARIAERDKQLNAFQLVLAERALAAARTAEQEIVADSYRGPLHGIPVAVKDLLTLRGTATTAGSRILADWTTDWSAAAVDRLEAAGAIIVGKTRMPEFAYCPGSTNPHYGPTRNPRSTEHDTGGSSSGSAAAVADGMVFAALGSDTGGSIRIPAAHCGLVGLKPTFGRISLYGAVSLAWSLDHLGPLTRSVTDAALLLEVLEGHDPRDGRTRSLQPQALGRIVAAAGDGARGLRIGVLRDDGSAGALGSPEVLERWRAGLDALARAGAELVELDIPEFNDLRPLVGAILAIEALAYHQPNLKTRLDDYGYFMRQRILAAYSFEAGTFVRAQQLRGLLRRRCDQIFSQVDLVSTPTLPQPAPSLDVPSATVFTGPFNLLGWPTITVPVGDTPAGLPVGLQLAGRPWHDATVLRAARGLEAALASPA